MRVRYDPEVDAAYVAFRHIEAGEAVENLVIGRRGKGKIVLDFNKAGTLLGVEIIGAIALAPAELLAEAEQL
jgi:uncharacterized protein YuzE